MTRILLVLLTFFGTIEFSFAADAGESLRAAIAAGDLNKLERIITRTEDTKDIWSKLGLFHDAVYALNRVAKSKTASPEAVASAKMILDAAVESSFDNYLLGAFPDQQDEKADPERLPYDVLLHETASLGEKFKMTYSTFEQFVGHKDPRVRVATAIWYSHHFSANSAEEGWFPNAPAKIKKEVAEADLADLLNRQSGWPWLVHGTMGYMMASPLGKVLARMAYNAKYDPSEESRAASLAAISSIRQELKVAQGPINEPEMTDSFSTRINGYRSRLSERLLRDINSILDRWMEQRDDIVNGKETGIKEFDSLYENLRSLVGAPPLPFCEDALTQVEAARKKAKGKE